MTTVNAINADKKVIDLSDADKFPKFNIKEFPERDGVRFGVLLRKELSLAGVLNIRPMFVHTFVRLGKTKAHASNYWDKTNKQLAGIDVHKTNKTWQAKQVKKKTVDQQPVSEEQIADPVVIQSPVVVETTPVVEHKRWLVVNKDTQEIVDSFTSRDMAQKDNKTRREKGENVTWKDGLKA